MAAFRKAAAEMQQVVKTALVGVTTDQADQVRVEGGGAASCDVSAAFYIWREKWLC